MLGPGVTEVRLPSDWFAGVRGTANDCNVYILDSGVPGATVLVLGGTHPEEPAGRLAARLLAENAVMETGRMIVVLSANRSATTVTRVGGAYPPDFTLETDWGERTFRLGDRWSNPLDQWPDPGVYIHYLSGQYLAWMDIRNLNRAWPGRPTARSLSARRTRSWSPSTRRAWTSSSTCTKRSSSTGRDEFVVRAGEAGLLFEKIDESGWPIAVRVGRHMSTILQTLEAWTELNPELPLTITGVPRYDEVVERGVGHWLHDPASAPPERVKIE